MEAQHLASKTREVAAYAKEVVADGTVVEQGSIPPSDTQGLRPYKWRATEFAPINDVVSVALKDESPDEESLALWVRQEVQGVRRQSERVAIIKPDSVEVIDVGPAEHHELNSVMGLLEYIDAYQQSDQAQES